jgi:hypothetical protein
MVFTDSRRKIERANVHTAALHALINGIPDKCTAVIEHNPAFGNESIKYDLPDTRIYFDIAILIGDAAHNLRCALDYAWRKTVYKVAPHKVTNSTKFPVREEMQQLIGALHGVEIDTICKPLFDFVMLDIKPYKGGDFSIWPVHQINNTDKHKLLIPVIQYGGITGLDTEDESGVLQPGGFSWGTTQDFPYYINMPLGWHVKNKGKVSIAIMFDKETFGEEFRTVDTLDIFSLYILQVIEKFERFFETL